MSRNLSLSTAQRFPAQASFNSHVLGLRPSYLRNRLTPTTPHIPAALDNESSTIRDTQTNWDVSVGRLQLHPHAAFQFPKPHMQLLVEHLHPSRVEDTSELVCGLPESVVSSKIKCSMQKTLQTRAAMTSPESTSGFSSSKPRNNGATLPVVWDEGVSMLGHAVNPEKLLMDATRMYRTTGKTLSVVVPCDEQLAGSLKGLASIYPHRFIWRSFDLNWLEASLMSPTSSLTKLQPNGDWGRLSIDDFEAEGLPRVRFYSLTPIVDPHWDLDFDTLINYPSAPLITKNIAAVLYCGSDARSGRLRSLPSLLADVKEDVVMPFLLHGTTRDNEGTTGNRIRSMDDVASAIGWHRFGPRLKVGVESVVDRSRLGF